ncbi:hypothetical protein QJQ45_011278 [Haematococcus lacustris]|nr:hypothetical protein QJQ45_011278 [Haematococcus lacustris]
MQASGEARWARHNNTWHAKNCILHTVMRGVSAAGLEEGAVVASEVVEARLYGQLVLWVEACSKRALLASLLLGLMMAAPDAQHGDAVPDPGLDVLNKLGPNPRERAVERKGPHVGKFVVQVIHGPLYVGHLLIPLAQRFFAQPVDAAAAQDGRSWTGPSEALGGWKPPAGQVEPRLLRPAWSQQRDQPVRGMMWCPVVPPRKSPQAPRSSQAATQPAASEPGPSTPLPAKRTKRTKAEPEAAEPTRLPKPSQHRSQAEQGALPAKGKEYPGLGYKRLRDKPAKAQQQQAPPI